MRDTLEKMWFNSSQKDGTEAAAGISARQNTEVGRDNGQPSLSMEFKVQDWRHLWQRSQPCTLSCLISCLLVHKEAKSLFLLQVIHYVDGCKLRSRRLLCILAKVDKEGEIGLGLRNTEQLHPVLLCFKAVLWAMDNQQHVSRLWNSIDLADLKDASKSQSPIPPD